MLRTLPSLALRSAALALPFVASLATPLAAPLGAQGSFLPEAAAVTPVDSNAPAVVVDSASPRAALGRFRTAFKANDMAAAVAYLDLTDAAARARGPELARRLAVVLDSRLRIELDALSPAAEGDLEDDLPLDREEIGRVPGADGTPVAIAMRRLPGRTVTGWAFTTGTVARTDELFHALPDAWVREHLPQALRLNGPLGLQWWQLIALLTLIPLSALVGWLLAGPVQGLLKRLVSRTETALDDALVGSARGPIMLLIGVATSRVLLRWLSLSAATEQFIVELQRATAVVAVFWILLRVIGVLQIALPATEWGSSHPAMRSLIPLGGRIARILVLITGLLTVIASFGYPIATILAGLGIGGIAVALGAQKTLEHFFGSVSIGVDQPFRVGDWVIIDGVEGEVEAIGLRSTRVRTLERTVVSFPNGRLADMRAENFGPRDRIRMRADIGLEYGTTAAQMQAVRDGIEAMLRAHPKTWPTRVVVRFLKFSSSSLDVEIFCWILTTDPDEFREIREAHYLGIMRIVEQSGARFAFPTQTVYLKNS